MKSLMKDEDITADISSRQSGGLARHFLSRVLHVLSFLSPLTFFVLSESPSLTNQELRDFLTQPFTCFC